MGNISVHVRDIDVVYGRFRHTAGERLQQVAAGVAELKADMAVIKSQSEESTKTLLEKGQTL